METVKKSRYLDLALYAFGGLGLEIVLMALESVLYGTNNFAEWGLDKMILHWIMTCVLWGSMSYYLYRTAKKDGFDILQFKAKPTLVALGGTLIIVCICLGLSYISWDGQLKVIGEFHSKMNRYGELGWLAYIFQYIYYFFETVLVVLIIAFGQKYGELVSATKSKYTTRIPWGGILCGISWGIVHWLTKGSISVGLEAAFCSVLYGIAYLLMKKNVRYAYIVITLMFIL